MFGQPYMHESHFGIDENGKTVLMGLGDIGVVPETFLAFTLPASIRLHFIAASLGLTDISDTLRLMAAISRFLWMNADTTLRTLTFNECKISTNYSPVS
jgi:hypothetical protein